MDEEIVKIKPFKINDTVTGNEVEVSNGRYLGKLRINQREYFFKKESGDFDGTGMPLTDDTQV